MTDLGIGLVANGCLLVLYLSLRSFGIFLQWRKAKVRVRETAGKEETSVSWSALLEVKVWRGVVETAINTPIRVFWFANFLLRALVVLPALAFVALYIAAELLGLDAILWFLVFFIALVAALALIELAIVVVSLGAFKKTKKWVAIIVSVMIFAWLLLFAGSVTPTHEIEPFELRALIVFSVLIVLASLYVGWAYPDIRIFNQSRRRLFFALLVTVAILLVAAYRNAHNEWPFAGLFSDEVEGSVCAEDSGLTLRGDGSFVGTAQPGCWTESITTLSNRWVIMSRECISVWLPHPEGHYLIEGETGEIVPCERVNLHSGPESLRVRSAEKKPILFRIVWNR